MEVMPGRNSTGPRKTPGSADTSREWRALAFDLGNVLIKVDHGRFCRGLAAIAGLSPQEIQDAVFATGLEPDYDTGRLSSREFYEGVKARFRLALPYPEFCRLWCEIFDPLEPMERVVQHLKERFALFLVSNTNVLHFDYIRQRFPGVLQPFQGFILSYRIGSRKPEPGIYQALIRQVGRAPEQILFLDDKLPFVEAARAHGLAAWHFVSPRNFQEQLSAAGLW